MPNIFLFLIIILSLISAASAQSSLGSGTFRNPFDDLYSGSPLLEFHADILDKNVPQTMRDTLIIDFESRQVTFQRIDRVTGMPLWAFHYEELEDFLRDIENHTRLSLWNRIVRERGRSARTASGANMTGLAFAVPANLPRWATRILGQEPPKLSITGTQRLYLGVRRRISGTRHQPERERPGPEFRPQSNFNIRGSVGQLLTLEINLRGDNEGQGYDFFEQARDQLSQVKIHYRESFPGELEDDIIQEVEIGRTSFQMPGHGLAGFSSGSNENLFGIRIRSRFGPLDVTTIASIENVENQRRTIRSGDPRTETTPEGGFIRNQFFFLDDLFREHAISPIQNVPRVIPERIQVYRRENFIPQNAEFRYAFHDGVSGQNSPHVFRRLRHGEDFIIHQNRPGVIQFLNRLSDTDLIGIYWDSEDERIGVKGDISDTTITVFRTSDTIEAQAIRQLWVLKDMERNPARDNLMLKNVYHISRSSQEDFRLRVLGIRGDGVPNETNEAGVHFTTTLGLANESGDLHLNNPLIFDLDSGFMFIPPFTRTDESQNPLWVFTNPALGADYVNRLIYIDTSGVIPQKFGIETQTRRRSERFHLDFGVVESSERIWTPAGDTLERHVDYNIDYSFGEVTLLSPRALAAEVLEVSYQRESLFLLDRKVFVGINALLNFPGVGRNSFLSTTLMWQLMDAKKMMPRVGTEPFNRFLFASTLNFDFAPLWMTSAVNLFPFVEREAQSSATFNVEVAYSQARSAARGGGEAFIDNFSASARTLPLSLSPVSWQRAAPDDAMRSNFLRNPPVWHQYWYLTATGDNRASRREIYPPDPNRHQQQDERISTLRLVAEPFPRDESLRGNVSESNGRALINPFAGITYGFSPHFMDRSDDRYFEFWIRRRNSRGTLTIDFGEISEDISLDGGLPNNLADVESFQHDIRPEDDMGLDLSIDALEYWLWPNFSVPLSPRWDTLRHGDIRLGEPNYENTHLHGWRFDPSRDNWRLYDRDNLQNRRFVNGTQGNDRVDREDVDGNGIVNITDRNFFRYTIDLSQIEQSRFFEESGAIPDSGWVRIRLPIGFIPEDIRNNPDIFAAHATAEWQGEDGTNGWRFIRHVRMLWTGISENVNVGLDSLEFEGLQFVGNLWREQVYPKEPGGVANITGQIVASILDSRSTPGYSPPLLKSLDTINGEQAVDYTLRLEVSDLPGGESAFVSRRFDGSQAMNLTNYRAIRFWAMDEMENVTQHKDNWFVLRFGSDSSTFYEFRTRRLEETFGWRGAGFTVDLEDLTDLKLAWFNSRGERHGSIDTTIKVEHGFLRVYTETRISPTLSNISWIAFGIENGSQTAQNFDLRINGFRASGIGDRSGWAARASMRLRWSDFMDNSFDFRYQDAGFRMMNQDILADSRTEMSSGMSGTLHLNRFFPDRMGLSIPLGGEIRTTVERPEMRPNSDINLRNEEGKTDNLWDMGGDFARVMTGRPESGRTTLSEEYEMRGRSRTAFTGFRQNRRPERIVPRLTSYRIGLDYRVTHRDSLARMGLIPEAERHLISRNDFEGAYHAELSASQTHFMGVNYDFSPSAEVMRVLSWQPLATNTNPNISRRMKSLTFNLLPERINFNLFDVDYNIRETYSSVRDVIDTTGLYVINSRPTEEVRMRHSLNITHKPINPFVNINYNVGINRNFDRFIRNWEQSGVSNFAREAVLSLDRNFGAYNILFSEMGRNQDIQLQFTPELTRWLTLTSNSAGNYSQNMETINDSTFMRTGITSSFNTSTHFHVRRLFEGIARISKERENFSQLMSNMARGLETVGFETVTFAYNASMRLSNSRLDMDYLDYGLNRSGGRFMLYSFGLFNRSLRDFMTGDMDDARAFGGVQHRNDWWPENIAQGNLNDSRNTSQNITTSTALRLPRPIDISINTISLGWTRTYNVTPVVERFDTTVIFPDLRLGLSSSAFEQLEAVRQNFSTFRLDWGYSFRRSYQKSGVPDVNMEERDIISWGFTPLLRTTFRLRRIGLGFTYQLDLAFDTTATYQSKFDENGDWGKDLTLLTQRRNAQNSWTANYSVPGRRGRTMRLFRDQVIEINGDMDYSLTIRYDRTHNDNPVLREKTGEGQDFTDVNISISPRFAYNITRNVVAGVFYDLNRSIRGRNEALSHQSNFGLEVSISF